MSDGFPIPICLLARAKRCKLFCDRAAFGYCAAKKQAYRGFHGHRVISFTGVLTALTVTAANGDERDAIFEVIGPMHGLRIGGTGLRRDNLVSVMYSEELNSTTSSVTHQRTDRHEILDQKLEDFQESL